MKSKRPKIKIEELIGRNQQIRTDIVALNSNVGARLATSFLIEQFNKFIERAGRYGDAVFITKDQASSTGSMLYYQVIKRLHRIVKGEQIGVSDIELRFKEDKNDAVSVPDFVYFMREEKLILTHQDIGDVTFVSLEQYFFEASDRSLGRS